MSDGFLGRWSRRKLDARQGIAPKAEPTRSAAPQTQATPEGEPAAQRPRPPIAQPQAPASQPQAGAPPPPPTLDDVKTLTAASDFSRFAARDVAPEVRNAALKKLFSDPRYNVMDGLDVYLDDYSKPSPMPEQTARQLASAAMRALDETAQLQETPARQPRNVVDHKTSESVSQSDIASAAVPEPTDHGNADLRLQQDDAAAGPTPGPGVA